MVEACRSLCKVGIRRSTYNRYRGILGPSQRLFLEIRNGDSELENSIQFTVYKCFKLRYLVILARQ